MTKRVWAQPVSERRARLAVLLLERGSGLTYRYAKAVLDAELVDWEELRGIQFEDGTSRYFLA